MKKLVALLLTAAIAAGCMAGCGTTDSASKESATESAKESTAESQATESKAEDSGAEEAAASAGDKSPLTLTAFLNAVPNPPDWKWGDDPTSKKITELTGITIENTYATTDDNTELNLLLASGEKLPDFIMAMANGSIRTSLVEQGFVLPLNKLADEHDPSFWEVLPKDMDKVYKEADGNFYVTTSWFGDADKWDDQILNTRGPVSVSIKKEYLDEIGRPEIKTLDDYAKALLQIKEKHPEINHLIFDQNADKPESSSGLLNLMARMYGATNNFFHWDGDNVSMVFMQDYYKDAMKAYNSLYRQGLINAERYAYKPDQIKGTYKAMDLASYVGYYWTLIDGIGNTKDVVYETIEYPLPEGKKPEDLKIHDDYFGVGSDGVYISKDTEHPDRAIQYLSFLQSKEGQLLHRYGVEGVTWTPDENGRPVDTQEKIDAQAGGENKLQKEYGVYNYNFSWLTSNWILVYGAEGTYKNFPCMLPDFEIMTPHQQNERFSDLTWNINGADQVALRDQIVSLWQQGAAKACTAGSDEEFEAAYSEFIANMNQAGVETLNGYFQESANHWKEVGLS